jgi:hypothetical protein
MATLHKEIVIDAPASRVWEAVRDVGAVHRRLVPGVLTDARLEPGEPRARIVSFANGMVVRELIVSIDDERRRFAYSAVGGRASHHNASLQVFDDQGPGRCRLVWITDLLPDDIAPAIAQLVELGSDTMKKTLEGPGLSE